LPYSQESMNDILHTMVDLKWKKKNAQDTTTLIIWKPYSYLLSLSDISVKSQLFTEAASCICWSMFSICRLLLSAPVCLQILISVRFWKILSIPIWFFRLSMFCLTTIFCITRRLFNIPRHTGWCGICLPWSFGNALFLFSRRVHAWKRCWLSQPHLLSVCLWAMIRIFLIYWVFREYWFCFLFLYLDITSDIPVSFMLLETMPTAHPGILSVCEPSSDFLLLWFYSVCWKHGLS